MELGVVYLGLRDYAAMVTAQEKLVERRRAGKIGDLLLLLEHPPTYTLGRRTEPGDLLHGHEWYEARGIKVSETPRGGKVTYHGPGQLVAYPIVDLRSVGDQPDGSGRTDVACFVSALETAMARTLRRWRVAAGTIEGLTGLWVDESGPLPEDATAASTAAGVGAGRIRKIGSIGLKVSRGITSHGLAVNVTDDLSPFQWINSCGIEHCAATSVSAELARVREAAGDDSDPAYAARFVPAADGVGTALAEELGEILGRDLEAVEPASLGFGEPLPTPPPPAGPSNP